MVASLTTTFLLNTSDKKPLIYNNVCSNESCPKFQFIAAMFIAISSRSSTSVGPRSNLPEVYCHKALSFRCQRNCRLAC